MSLPIIIALAIIFVITMVYLNIRARTRKKREQRWLNQSVPKEPRLNLYEVLEEEDIVIKAVSPEPTAAAEKKLEDSDSVLGLKSQTKMELNSVPFDMEKEITQENKPKATSAQNSTKVVVFYVMATEGHTYNGYELLQALLTAGFRYGKMSIFHRHEQKTGRGPILFSLASATEPGTFELSKMGGFSCAGLVLFLELNKTAQSLQAFELMLETAHQLADDLGGEVLDETRVPLMPEKIMELRGQVNAYQEARE